MVRFGILFILLVLSACDNAPSTGTPPDTGAPTVVQDLLEGDIALTPDPHGIAPLTAEAVFNTKTPVRVTLTVPGEERVTQTFPAATEHRIPILGLYPDTDNQVTLRLESDEGAAETTLSVITDPLPEEFPAVSIITADRDEIEPGWNLNSFRLRDTPERASPFMYDPRGVIRWYLDLPVSGRTSSPERVANGNLIYGFESTLYEYDMLGEKVNQWEIPGYRYHHEIVEKPNGNLIVAVDKEGLDTIEDFVIEVDRETGEIVSEWDFRESLDVDRQTFDDDEEDWLHMNAIFYDERDDTLIISGRVQGLAKVTADNELVWILAPHKGWGENGDGEDTADYLLTAVDADSDPYPEAVQQGDEDAPDFSWVWGQHAPLILPNGNLFVFDNGENRNFSSNGDFTQDSPSFSRGVEYAIDEEALTVEQVWQYGKARGEAFYSPIISDVDYLPETGNRLIMPGIISVFSPPSYALMTEVTYPGKEVVFEARLEFKNLLEGDSIFGDSIYRAERLPLYPDAQ